MSKKIQTVEEAVGDTSGYQEKPAWNKKRTITLISSLVGIILVIVISIFLFTTPRKIDFKFEDGVTNSQRFEINKETNMLVDAPKDPKRSHFKFEGWYLDKDCKNGGYFNNDKNKSLTETNFKGVSALFAKWSPIHYDITYNMNLSSSDIAYYENNNPYYVTIKHEATPYEIQEFADYLREKDPDKYVNDKNAMKNLNHAMDIYKSTSKLSERVLAKPTCPGKIFVKWVDDNGKEITTLSQTDPEKITLNAIWQNK